MPAPSIFQCLPLHIAEAVSRYCDSQPQSEPNDSWLVLHDLSYSWRILALERFYHKASIVVSPTTGESTLGFRLMPRTIKPDTVLFSLIKSVDVRLGSETRQHNSLPFAWPKSLVFSSARFLSIDLAVFVNQHTAQSEDSEDGESWSIAQRIRTSMPRLQEVDVFDSTLWNIASVPASTKHKWSGDDLLSTVFEKVRRVRLNTQFIRLVNGHSFMQRCSGLTDLRFDCLYNIELFVHVVKESAHTLESLRVQFYHTQPMKFLVYDDKDQPIVYSRLKKLVVYGRYRSTFEKKISVDDSVVPFPELRYLSWWSEYPFADDTLFRGNRRSLECLDITFTPHLVDVWQKHKVFFRGRHPRLSVLKLRKDNRSALRNANDNVQCLKSAFNLISPESQTLAVPFPYACQHIFCVMPATFYVRNIRSLHLDNSRFTLLEMLSLVKRLPNMESLECLPGNIDDEINVGRNVAFVDDLYKEYYPLSNRFKHWISKKVYAEFVRPAALTSIALAILSPRYTSTRLAHFDREKYQREIKCAIDCGLYDKHIAKLERLYKRI